MADEEEVISPCNLFYQRNLCEIFIKQQYININKI